ncbi:hypothetical protein NVP1020O_18 [Vibrio phage 1.020.O._10N.222.48.A2]|uniref:Uncharacterized protein n=1 Tax=Vibrio phage 1.020.O._10N.222.48.A2 TaxID=1881450 RepID=A0A2I7QKY6_9VIRU|nr:hypothetical protein KMD66_gp18 [Vibrio phage 1.020.O._10N.222.48.A2]AUR82060.1 hypothetical protein NVP1020O_18 [Vibrio phage 1.020.O._10N.222.48.A2]
MALIRDYHLTEVAPLEAETRVVNVVGNTIVVRRAVDAGAVRVKAYTKDGGALVTDNVLSAGEKIRTAVKFTRLEITNLESTKKHIHITAGEGDFQSDVVEGEVTVLTSDSSPLKVVGQVVTTPSNSTPTDIVGTVITREAKFDNVSRNYAHTSGTPTSIPVPANAVKFGIQNVTAGEGAVYLSGAHVYIQPKQVFSIECSDDLVVTLDQSSHSGTYNVFWVTQP